MKQNNKNFVKNNLSLVGQAAPLLSAAANLDTEQRSTQDDHYNRAVRFASELQQEHELRPLLQRIFSAACNLLPMSGMNFQQSGGSDWLEFGKQAIHTLSFTLADKNREYGDLVFYHANRLIPYEESAQILENLLALSLPAIQTCLENQDSHRQSTRQALQNQLAARLSQDNCGDSLVLIHLNDAADQQPIDTPVSEGVEQELKNVIHLACQHFCSFSSALSPRYAALVLPTSKANFIAERIRLLIASDAQNLGTTATITINEITLGRENSKSNSQAKAFLNQAVKHLENKVQLAHQHNNVLENTPV
ncbi:MAG: hypothetical protein KUG75_03370 [Pseudomonadales bacterium]|nr:hypothetical protein [Pseudomonadales bacterium]